MTGQSRPRSSLLGTAESVACRGFPWPRNYDGISLDVDELGELIDWLSAVAADQTGPPDEWNKSVIRFVEPDIAARVTARAGDEITIRWYLKDATSIEDLSTHVIFTRDLMTYPATSVDVVASSHDVAAAAHDLAEALRNLVRRRPG